MLLRKISRVKIILMLKLQTFFFITVFEEMCRAKIFFYVKSASLIVFRQFLRKFIGLSKFFEKIYRVKNILDMSLENTIVFFSFLSLLLRKFVLCQLLFLKNSFANQIIFMIKKIKSYF